MADMFTTKIKGVRFAMAVEFVGQTMQSCYNGKFDMTIEFIKGTKGCVMITHTKTGKKCLVLDNNIAYITLEDEV